MTLSGALGPVLELVPVELAGRLKQAFLHAGLGVEDGVVVDRGADLFEEEVEELAGGSSPRGSGRLASA